MSAGTLASSLYHRLGSAVGLGMVGLGAYGTYQGGQTGSKGFRDILQGNVGSGLKHVSGGALGSAINSAMFNDVLLTSLLTKGLGLGTKARAAVQAAALAKKHGIVTALPVGQRLLSAGTTGLEFGGDMGGFLLADKLGE